ncbi:MAG TPA: SRPBCC family protein [Planctomycetota bacterium]|nr:SRPBCC family protein [Planctomycetota bacterium]
MDGRIEIDPDIRVARTLPAACYRDPAFLERCRETVFARSWQLAADEETVAEPGRVHPFPFLDGCVDEPLLLARDRQGAVRCLSNVCTHRGNLVVQNPGSCTELKCAYHGRRFALDGSFEHMPEFKEAAGFPTKADDLPRLPLERWGMFLYTALRPACTFSEWSGEVARRLAGVALHGMRPDPTRSRDYEVRANWALYVDNYLEGFHIPFIHGGLNAELDYGSYATELFRRANLQVGYAEGTEAVLDLPPGSPDRGRQVAAYYAWLFPNLMLNFYPWGLSINIVKPLAVDRTRVTFLSYVRDESKLDRGAGAGLDRVELEDEAVVEATQRGVRSRLYDRGRYSPTREQGVHHFHRLLAEAANG